MKLLENQRRSTNIEDLRTDPLSELIHSLIAPSADAFNQVTTHPWTRAEDYYMNQYLSQPVPPPTPLGEAIGYHDVQKFADQLSLEEAERMMGIRPAEIFRK